MAGPGAVAARALAAAVLAAAGATAGPGGAAEKPVEHRFETILAAAHSGLAERRREVIRDEASWAQLWADIHTSVTPTPPLPAVDFTRDMLIAVATGTRPSGGFGVEVRSVAIRGERVEVGVFERCPAPGAMVSMALTRPVEVVRVARLTQAVTFQDARAASCR